MSMPFETSLNRDAAGFTRRNMMIATCAALAIAGCVDSRTLAARSPTILFICQFGTAKSPIAREVFRRVAREQHVDAHAISRGLTLEDHLSPEIRARLTHDGIMTDADPLAILTPDDWRSADIVIAFNPLPLDVRPANLRDWTSVPSFNQDYDNALADMTQRVRALVAELSRAA
jgi:protein-tyrosine-phosphatase